MVSYRDLGLSAAEGRDMTSSHEERTCASRPRPPSSYLPRLVFQRMRRRLAERHSSLTDRIRALLPNPDTLDLTETDLQKILEDSWVVLDQENFSEFAKGLGVRDGRIRRSAFQAKYEEATSSAGEHLDSAEKSFGSHPASAEQVLAALKSRVKLSHGSALAAFRLMDRKCKGVVSRHDFKVLYSSLGFFCSEAEYDRLLGLIGLHPGATLNYAAFANVLENDGKPGAGTTNVQDQLHELLASDARCKWADMSKVLCRSDADGHSRIDKNALRSLLYTYALPLGPGEFDGLWSRYDVEERGSLALGDFLEKLGLDEGEVKSQSQKLKQTGSQLDLPLLTDAASLEHVRLGVSTDDKRLHYLDFLSDFDPKAEKKHQPPPDAVQQIQPLDGLSPDVALARMRERVSSSAPDLFKTFSAFDRDETGTVKALEFRRVQESFCLSDKQYRRLLSELELDGDKSTVNWKDFLSRFQGHNPLIADRKLGGSRERASMPSSLEFPQQMPEEASGHQIRIGTDQLCSRLWPRSGTAQLERVWRQAEQRKLQCGEFQTPGRTQSAPQGTSRRPGTGRPAGGAERRLRAAMQRCWREIQRRCSTEDAGRAGRISTGSFLGILQSLDISVSREQLEGLAVKRGCVKNGCVLYNAFLQSFLLNLNPAETTKAFERLQLPLPVTRTNQGVLTQGGAEVMFRTYDVIRSSWASVRRGFLSADPAHTGSVSVQAFRQVLGRFGVMLSEEELFHLCSYLDAKATGSICYNNFLWTFLH